MDGLPLSGLSGFGECQVYENSESKRKVIDVAALLGKSTGLALVDCSASSETVGVLNQVVDLGCCIVLANKKPLTSTLEDYDKLVSYPRRIRHESTVGAGLPVIASLNRIISSGDPVHRIVGSLSDMCPHRNIEVGCGHWYLFVIDIMENKVYILDSLQFEREYERVCDCRKILDFFNIWLDHPQFDSIHFWSKPNFNDYSVELGDVRQQSNTNDCGIYVIQYLRNIEDLFSFKHRKFDSTRSPIWKEITLWIISHKLNAARNTAYNVALSYKCFTGRKNRKKEVNALKGQLEDVKAALRID